MDNKWAPGLIADYIVKHCRSKESLDGKEAMIDIIVTFDDEGVSLHPNHCAIFDGVSKIMNDHMLELEVLTLTTVHILRKYIAIADVNFCFTDEWQCFRYNMIEAYRTLAEHQS